MASEQNSSGRIIIGLGAAFLAEVRNDARVAECGDFRLLADKRPEIKQILDKFPAFAGLCLVEGSKKAQSDLEDSLRSLSGRQLGSLTSFFALDTRSLSPGERKDLLAALRALPRDVVASAYLEGIHVGAQSGGLAKRIKSFFRRRFKQQDHFRARPQGIGLPLEQVNRGSGVRFADVEGGWTAHECLPDLPTPTASEPLAKQRAHGTAVLGIILAGAPGSKNAPIRGVAPHARLAGLFSTNDGGVVNAIHKAIDALEAGDVLVLPIDIQGHRLPIETEPAVFQAIQLAVCKGIVVVEAAGNSIHDLNAVADDPDLAPAWAQLEDGQRPHSGAILVGGCRSATEELGHLRDSGTNSGSRVDCFAWSEDVLSAGPGYTDYEDFDGSSSATALVAGIALLIQQKFTEQQGAPMTPFQLRHLLRHAGPFLSDKATTPVVDVDLSSQPKFDHFDRPVISGHMPDVKQLLARLRKYPDLQFDQDRALNTSTGALLWASADLRVRAKQTSAVWPRDSVAMRMTDAYVVASGKTYFVDARVRNVGRARATKVTVKGWWRSRPAAEGIPSEWKVLPDFPVADSISVGFKKELGSVEWRPPAGLGAGTVLDFLAVVGSDADPPPALPPEALSDEALAALLQGFNNVAMTSARLLNGGHG